MFIASSTRQAGPRRSAHGRRDRRGRGARQPRRAARSAAPPCVQPGFVRADATSLDHIPLSLQRRVRLRDANRCEYRGIAQAGQEATLPIDHVHPRRDGGPTTLDNLALSCVSCSFRRGARTEARNPHTQEIASVFNPHVHRWEDHFELAESFLIIGKTAVGRGSSELLRMNRPVAVETRSRVAQQGSSS